MKISRLFEMVFLLMNKKTISAKELASYFEVSTRTIYRDIDILNMAGIPIYANRGRNGGISLLDHYVLNKSLVSKEEQQQILTSLKSLSFTSEKEVSQTLRKLNSFFDVKDENWLDIDYRSWSSNEDYQQEFQIFREAIQQQKQISLYYYNKNGESLQRIIEPYKVMYKGSDWYVYAYCTKANDFRFFKFSRMMKIKIINNSFIKKEAIEPINTNYPLKKCEVIIKVDKRQAYRVLDEMKNEIIDEHKNYFLIKIHMDEAWLYSYLFGYLDQIEVIEPEEVREQMHVIAKNILNKY